MNTPYSIRLFPKQAASDLEYRRVTDFLRSMETEELPDDPPRSMEEFLQSWRNLPDFYEEECYAVWDTTQDEVVGYSQAWVMHTGDNEHLCSFRVCVQPQHRGHGLSRHLLPKAVDFACRHNRRLMESYTMGTIQAGVDFLSHLGAKPGLVMHINQLKIDDLPAGWVEKWLKAGEELSEQFELGLVEGPVPDEHMEGILSALGVVIRDAPRDQLDREDFNMSAETWRETEKNWFARGFEHWVLYARDRSNGRYVGLTELVWNRNRPSIIEQGGTGVFPEYRGRGLGHWLKAAMVQKLLRDHPETRMIRTGNATTNQAMLKINHEMGFKPYTAMTIWQIERTQVEAYLASRPAAVSAVQA